MPHAEQSRPHINAALFRRFAINTKIIKVHIQPVFAVFNAALSVIIVANISQSGTLHRIDQHVFIFVHKKTSQGLNGSLGPKS